MVFSPEFNDRVTKKRRIDLSDYQPLTVSSFGTSDYIVEDIINYLSKELECIGIWTPTFSKFVPLLLTGSDFFPKELQLKIFTGYCSSYSQQKIFCFPNGPWEGVTLCLGQKDNYFVVLRHYRNQESWIKIEDIPMDTESFFNSLFKGIKTKGMKVKLCGGKDYHNQRRLFSMFCRERLSDQLKCLSFCDKIQLMNLLDEEELHQLMEKIMKSTPGTSFYEFKLKFYMFVLCADHCIRITLDELEPDHSTGTK